MEVKFYNTISDPDSINKFLSDELTLSCQFTDVNDFENPRLLLDLSAAKISRNYASFNGKFYFLEEPSIVNGHHVEIQAHIDDLMTHREAILNSPVIASRSSSNWEPYIVDDVVSDSGKITTYIRQLAEIFDTQNATNNYIVILGG